MLKIYLSRGAIKEGVITTNDAYFDLHLSDIKFDSTVLKLIKNIDGVDYAGKHAVYSKYHKGAVVRVEELSTGCKTAINVYSFPQKVFYAGECGDNALYEIYGFNRGNVFMNYFSIPKPFRNEICIKADKKEKIVGNNNELEKILYSFYR